MADRAISQINEQQLFYSPDPNSNSIAILMQHMSGNMLSRWTDFLNSDGEKEGRNRDAEFELKYNNKESLSAYWEKGWECLFQALSELSDSDVSRIIYIRKEPLTVIDAIHRQLTHYACHVGQIMYIAKMQKGAEWQSLSIPKNKH